VHYYHAFGLKLASDLLLPELHPGSGPPDASIRLSWSSERMSPLAPFLSVKGAVVTFNLEGIRFTVEGGHTIGIVAPRGTGEPDIRVWLLGTVMAGLLHQRGYFLIHANAVCLANGFTAAFAGPSGAGKSTMAALLESSGFRVLGDDLCAISFDGLERPMLYAGIPRLKLWRETLDFLGRQHSGLERVATDLAKYHVPLGCASEEGQLAPLCLERLYVLGQRTDPAEPLVTRLGGVDAAAAILDNAFRWGIGQSIQGSGSRFQFDQCLAIARHTAVFRVARRWGINHLLEEGNAIAQALADPLTNSDAARGDGT
jgi:hypothetical protein